MEEQESQELEIEDDVTIDEEESTDYDSDNGENDADFSDGDDDGDDEGEDGEEQEPDPKDKSDKKPWKNERNAEDARIRRRAEQEAEIKIKQARNEAIIEALGGVNPYTGDKLEDAADVEEYLTMKEIEKAGKDPVTDYSRYLKNKAKEQEKATSTESSQEEWIAKDREEFVTKHPDVKFEELASDEMFRTFAEGKVGKIPMTKIYADYKAFEKKSEERAKTRAAQILANKTATPGRLSNQTPTQEKSINEMSLEEFRAFDEKVKSGKIKLK